MTQPSRATKRPATIEFMRWEGGAEAATPIIDWILANGGTATWDEEHWGPLYEDPSTDVLKPETLTIRTLEGYITASVGDVIIKGVQGEFYPCKPDVFAETYDINEEPA